MRDALAAAWCTFLDRSVSLRTVAHREAHTGLVPAYGILCANEGELSYVD
jgi:hypothetical protein